MNDNVIYLDFSCGGRALGLAIIHQALIDLVSKNPREKIQKIDAQLWFFGRDIWFPVICDLAGLEPERVRARAAEVKKNPALLGKLYE